MKINLNFQALLLLSWSKWAITRLLIVDWFSNVKEISYLEAYLTGTLVLSIAYFIVPQGLDTKGFYLELALKFLFYMVLLNYLRASFGDPGYVDKMELVDKEGSILTFRETLKK